MTLLASSAQAQRRMMRRIVPTTLVLEKLRADPERFDPGVIWLGVYSVTYGFLLRDAYTDLSEGDSEWSELWQLAKPFRPNFHVLGQQMEKIAQIKPGEIVTLKGMYAPGNRTFEITEMMPGIPFKPPDAY